MAKISEYELLIDSAIFCRGNKNVNKIFLSNVILMHAFSHLKLSGYKILNNLYHYFFCKVL